MIASDEMDLTFAQYAVKHNIADIKLDENGSVLYEANNKRIYNEAKEKYFDWWLEQRKERYQFDKEEAIKSAIARIKAKGLEYEVKSYQNAHINVKSKHSKTIFAYYATTGTIAGYWGTPVNGVERLIELCEKY